MRRLALLALALALALALTASAMAQENAAPDNIAPELLRSARIWEVKGRAEFARAALEKLLQARPDDAQALLQLGLLEVRSDRYERARELLARLVAAHPGDRRVRELEDALRLATTDRPRLATLRRLQELQRVSDDAAIEAAKLRLELFPQGPPSGPVAIDYYQGIAGEDGHWEEAHAGFERLVRENPEDAQYRLALARHELRREATRQQALNALAALAQRPDANRYAVMDAWRGALEDLPAGPARLAEIRRYLERAPADAQVMAMLTTAPAAPAARVQRSAAARPAAAAALPAAPAASPVAPPSPREQALQSWTLKLEQARQQAEPERLQALTEAVAGVESGNLYRVCLAARRLGEHNDSATAEALYDTVLALDPINSTALSDWSALLARSARGEQARTAIAALRRQQPQSGDTLDRVEATLLDDEAQAALDSDRHPQARELLEKALALSADDPWRSYRLARLYADAGDADRASRLMEQASARAPNNADAHYAQALLLSRIGEDQQALGALLPIPVADRSEGMLELWQTLEITVMRHDALRLRAAGDQRNAEDTLAQARVQAGSDAAALADIADTWAAMGEPRYALDLLGETATSAAEPSASLQLAWAELARRLSDEAALDAALAPLRAQPPDESEPLRRYRDLESRLALQHSRRLEEAGQHSAALAALDQGLQRVPQEPGLRRRQAALLMADNRPREAAAVYAGLLTDNPGDIDLHLARADALQTTDRAREAESELAAAEALPRDDEQTLALARARLQRGEPNAAAALYRQASTTAKAQSALAELNEQRDGRLTIGLIPADKPGDPGISQLNSTELPLELRMAAGYSAHVFARADATALSAGRLPADYEAAAGFGQVQARGPQSLQAFADGVDVKARGVVLAAGVETEHWQADAGRTPGSFPVANWTGGLRYDDSLGALDYRVELSRRPVTSSLVSYAGARDPVTGAVWGGVTGSGLAARAGWNRGRLGLAGSLDAHRYTGRNVLDNSGVKLRAEGDWRLLDGPGYRLFGGLNASYWSYEHNLRYYSFGHGGYYSPQSYLSLSAPLDLRGGFERWSWQLRAAASYSWSREEDAPFYPNDPELQALAENSPLPSGFDAPVYDGGNGSGFGYSAAGALEFLWSPDWSLGARAEIDRSDYYEPTRLYFYVRHRFDQQLDAAPVPPRAIYPYAER